MIRAFILAALFLASAVAQTVSSFLGRDVTITKPQLDDVFFPRGPARICVEGPPEKQCYTTPEGFGRNPKAEVVQLKQDWPALLFSAETGGAASFRTHFVLLRPGTESDLDQLLFDVTLSNGGEHAFWSIPSISDAKILLTADGVPGPGGEHNDDTRFLVSVYFPTAPDPIYYLEDQYMTVRKYGFHAGRNVLAAEKPEIMARLRRVVAAQKPH